MYISPHTTPTYRSRIDQSREILTGYTIHVQIEQPRLHAAKGRTRPDREPKVLLPRRPGRAAHWILAKRTAGFEGRVVRDVRSPTNTAITSPRRHPVCKAVHWARAYTIDFSLLLSAGGTGLPGRPASICRSVT